MPLDFRSRDEDGFSIKRFLKTVGAGVAVFLIFMAVGYYGLGTAHHHLRRGAPAAAPDEYAHGRDIPPHYIAQLQADAQSGGTGKAAARCDGRHGRDYRLARGRAVRLRTVSAKTTRTPNPNLPHLPKKRLRTSRRLSMTNISCPTNRESRPHQSHLRRSPNPRLPSQVPHKSLRLPHRPKRRRKQASCIACR
jgi:hypothetical protein